MPKLIKTQRVSNIHIVFFFRGKLKVQVCNKLCLYLLITLFTYIPIKNWYFFYSWCVCLCLLAVITLSSSQTLERETCDARRSEVDVNVPSADALIGGIFMIREPLFGGYTCGGPHRGMTPVNIEKKFQFFYKQYKTKSKRLN